MPSTIGIGLIGYGGIGRLHALCYRMLPLVYPNLALLPQIVAVATAGAASAERARRELGDILATTELEALLSHSDIAVVDCCAPTGDHAVIGRAALAAGKALLCEKPLTADPDESAALVGMARERGLTGGVHYHFRAIPAIQEARRQIEAGLLGEVIGFQMRYYRASNLRADRPINWRFAGPGSGVLIDLGAHLIDLTLHLLGPISAVATRARTLIATRTDAAGQTHPVEADDDVRLEVELAGGGLGTIVASKVVPGAGDDLRLEVYGRRGALTFDSRDPNSLIVARGTNAPPGGELITTLSRGTPPAALPGAETLTTTLQWHLAAIAGFFDALGRGAPVPAGLEDGLRVDSVIAGARRSVEASGARVAVEN